MVMLMEAVTMMGLNMISWRKPRERSFPLPGMSSQMGTTRGGVEVIVGEAC